MDPWLVGEESSNDIDLLKDLGHGSCSYFGEAYFKHDIEVSLLKSQLGEVVPVSGYFFRLQGW